MYRRDRTQEDSYGRQLQIAATFPKEEYDRIIKLAQDRRVSLAAALRSLTREGMKWLP